MLEAEEFGSRYLLLPLHSMVPPADQKAVFKPAPPGVRKVRPWLALCVTGAPNQLRICRIAGHQLRLWWPQGKWCA